MDTRFYILEQDEVLFKSKYHTISVTPSGFEYDAGKPGVAILPYRKIKDSYEFLLRKETKAVQGKIVTVITGRKDGVELDKETASRELKEEAGYSVSKDKFVDLGSILLGKQSPVPDRIFTVDLTGIKAGTATTDGTLAEKQAENFWVDERRMDYYVKSSPDSHLNVAFGKVSLYLGL